jgi:SpoVK/Ycf46/Vps4 family AAA+-type ATPase
MAHHEPGGPARTGAGRPPGARIDHAVEIRLPDSECRRRLLELYLHGVDHDDELDEIVTRTEGTTASFIKELCRRAVLAAAEMRTDGDSGAPRLAPTRTWPKAYSSNHPPSRRP